MKYINVILIVIASVGLLYLFILGGNNTMEDKTARLVLYACLLVYFILNYKNIWKKRKKGGQ